MARAYALVFQLTGFLDTFGLLAVHFPVEGRCFRSSIFCRLAANAAWHKLLWAVGKLQADIPRFRSNLRSFFAARRAESPLEPVFRAARGRLVKFHFAQLARFGFHAQNDTGFLCGAVA